jgi:hypothetical protein
LSALLGGEQAAGSKTAPDWVPPLMVSLASAMRPFGQEIVDRLLTDPQMESVWRILRAKSVDQAALEKLPPNLRLDNWVEASLETRDATANDAACAAFFAYAVIIFTLGNRSVKEQDIKREMSRWRDGAAICREALSGVHRATVDPALAAALSMSADYFEEWARSLERSAANSPYLIGRGALERAPGGKKNAGGDENVRGQVCDVANLTQQVFGSFLHKPVATTASVATGLVIASKSVENWSRALRIPSSQRIL